MKLMSRFPSLALRKYVIVSNWRINVLYYTLVFMASTGMLLLVWFDEVMMMKHNLHDEIQASLWINGTENVPSMASYWAGKALCETPEQYDYWWSETERYENYQCAKMCTPLERSTCIEATETHFRGQDTVFMATSVRQELPNLANQAEVDVNGNGNFFLAGVKALGITISYTYNVEDHSDWPVNSNLPLQADSTTDLTTLLVKRDESGNLQEEPWRVEAPGPAITLSLPEILELAGTPGALDQWNEFAGKNEKPDTGHPGPVTHISGMEVHLEIDCFNTKHAFGKILSYTNVPDKACILSARRTNKGWVAREEHVVLNDFVRHRTYNGVAIKVRPSGYFLFFSMNNLISMVVTFIVIMKIPSVISGFVLCFTLGHTSKIYRRQIFEEVDIRKSLGGTAMRLMGYVNLYNDLSDERSHITKDDLLKSFKGVLDAGFDEKSVEHIVDFCYDSVVHDDPKKSRLKLTSQTSVGRNSTDSSEAKEQERRNKHILPRHFCEATLSNEAFTLKTLVETFNPNRRLGLFERLFMPLEMRNARLVAKEALANVVTSDVATEPVSDGSPKQKESQYTLVDPTVATPSGVRGDTYPIDFEASMATGAAVDSRATTQSQALRPREWQSGIKVATPTERKDALKMHQYHLVHLLEKEAEREAALNDLKAFAEANTAISLITCKKDYQLALDKVIELQKTCEEVRAESIENYKRGLEAGEQWKNEFSVAPAAASDTQASQAVSLMRETDSMTKRRR